MRHDGIRSGLFVLSLLVPLGACAGWPSGQEEPVTRHMYAHFGRLGEIQTAVIRGDLDGARRSARMLAEHPPLEGFPTSLDSYEDEMRTLAREAGGAASLETAADLTARMASTCGACHRAYEGGPRMDPGGHAARGSDTADRMLRHLWGADRMWEGLLGPSDELWRRGAGTLAEEEGWSDLPSGYSEESERLAERVRRVARVARRVDDEARRADLYGDLLETCSGCHQLTADGEVGTGR